MPRPAPTPTDVLPALRAALLAWFGTQRRDLPWRRTRDPYAIWISEVMLQQTQVATVIPYWERFLARLPTFEALADANPQEVLSLWRGLGYYRRARALQEAAADVVARFGGRLPADPEALATLPTFGPYTVGAVASIAFGLNLPLVDGNVARVLSRLFEVEGAQGDRARERRLWELARALVPGERPGDWNQALMELGATVCRPESPLCLLCPVRAHCGALASGRIAELPPPKVRAPRTSLLLGSGVWRRGKKILLARRPEGGLFGGLWELPSVTAVQPQDLEGTQAALRELLGTSVRLGACLGTVARTLTHRDLRIELWPIQSRGQPRPSAAYAELAWKDERELPQLAISTAMQRALEAALRRDVELLPGEPEL